MHTLRISHTGTADAPHHAGSGIGRIAGNDVPTRRLLVSDGSAHPWFHEIGLVHPDLNARNILVSHPGSAEAGIYLIDLTGPFFACGQLVCSSQICCDCAGLC
jgi:hypothetical protein